MLNDLLFVSNRKIWHFRQYGLGVRDERRLTSNSESITHYLP